MTASSVELRKIYDAARPLIEESLDLAETIADIRTRATALGFDWSQVKALLKAQVQDERDERGDGRRVARIIDKADNATAYADMLGLGEKVNEKNFSEASETKDLDDAAPPDERPSPVEGDTLVESEMERQATALIYDTAKGPDPGKRHSVNGGEVGGDPDLLNIPPHLRRPVEGAATETDNQPKTEGDPDPFDWQGDNPPDAPNPNEAIL